MGIYETLGKDEESHDRITRKIATASLPWYLKPLPAARNFAVGFLKQAFSECSSRDELMDYYKRLYRATCGKDRYRNVVKELEKHSAEN